MKSFISLTKTLILALLIGLGVSYAFATTGWQDPTQAPPGGNTPAPINVGTSLQTKTGSLTVLGVLGTKAFILDDGNQGAGKVLTSNADGEASWGTAGGSNLSLLTTPASLWSKTNSNASVNTWYKVTVDQASANQTVVVRAACGQIAVFAKNTADTTNYFSLTYPSNAGADVCEGNNNDGDVSTFPITLDANKQFDVGLKSTGNSGWNAGLWLVGMY